MIDKIVKLVLGGQERTLLYGAMGYYEYIEKETGLDPFDWLVEFDKKRADADGKKITVLIKDIAVIIYSGINSHLDSIDEPNIPFEKVKKWCNGISIDTASLVLKTAFGTLETGEPGELQPQGGQENGQENVSV